jgi:LysM repeat protein
MRRTSSLLLIAFLLSLSLASAARAGVPHVVQPGETLWSIAAANNFTTRALAAANGLPDNGNVVLGSTVKIPTVGEAAAAMSARGIVPAAAPGTGAVVEPGTPAGSAAPSTMGSYVVKPGDSLSGLAARSRVPLSQFAYMNGLKPDRPLLIGTVLKLPTGSPVPTSTPAASTRVVVPNSPPNPTPERVSASQIQQVAAANGVPSSLAAAVGWQESGFNNALVSSANARGVMQILPGTWDWVNRNLAGRQLDPNSALGNVHAGVLYLRNLLQQTGGDPATAAAGYYQGLASVRRNGMLPDTQRYVTNVLALRSRFGG